MLLKIHSRINISECLCELNGFRIDAENKRGRQDQPDPFWTSRSFEKMRVADKEIYVFANIKSVNWHQTAFVKPIDGRVSGLWQGGAGLARWPFRA